MQHAIERRGNLTAMEVDMYASRFRASAPLRTARGAPLRQETARP